MQDFDLYLPTHIVFGKGRVNELGKLVAGKGERVLITYGGGSVVKSGLLDAVKAQLSGAHCFRVRRHRAQPEDRNVKKSD